jgi:putative ABC transport system permease protein
MIFILPTNEVSGHPGAVQWEVFPTAVVALVVGVGLGLGVPWLVFGAVDLRPLTGAREQPAVVVDWLLVGGAVGVFVVVVVAAVMVAVVSSRRLRLGTVLRVGEDT